MAGRNLIFLAVAIGLGLIAVPALSRPDQPRTWPLLLAGALAVLALIVGTLGWMQSDWAMPVR
mgnify:CR=1 FL=1